MSFAALMQKATSISAPYKLRTAEDDEFWEGSSFNWIRRLPSRTRGTVGQDLARSVFEECGYIPVKRKNSFEVNGVTIISRSSMLWDFRDWKFQQVRNTPFEYLFCLGLYPDTASAWLIPKEELYIDGDLQEREGWGRQHGGKTGKEDSWLIVPTMQVPSWMGTFGGNIDNIAKVLKRSLG